MAANHEKGHTIGGQNLAFDSAGSNKGKKPTWESTTARPVSLRSILFASSTPGIVRPVRCRVSAVSRERQQNKSLAENVTWARVAHLCKPLYAVLEGPSVAYVVDDHDHGAVIPVLLTLIQCRRWECNSASRSDARERGGLTTCSIWLNMGCPAVSNKYSSTAVLVSGMFTI